MILSDANYTFLVFTVFAASCHLIHTAFSFKVAAEVAAPLSSCQKVTMISSGNGAVGASKITGEVLEIVSKLPKAIEEMTGIDISKVKFLAL